MTLEKALKVVINDPFPPLIETLIVRYSLGREALAALLKDKSDEVKWSYRV